MFLVFKMLRYFFVPIIALLAVALAQNSSNLPLGVPVQLQQNNLCLGVVASAAFDTEAALELQPCSPDPNTQSLMLEAQTPVLGRQRVKLKFLHSQKCVDLYAGSLETGAKIVQWECNNESNNQMFFPEWRNNTLRFVSQVSGQYLEIGVQNACDPSCAVQSFRVLQAGQVVAAPARNPLFFYPPKLELGQVWKLSFERVEGANFQASYQVARNREGFFAADSRSVPHSAALLEVRTPDNWYFTVKNGREILECNLSWTSADDFDTSQPLLLRGTTYFFDDSSTTEAGVCSLQLEQTGTPISTPHPLYNVKPERGQVWTAQFEGAGTWKATTTRLVQDGTEGDTSDVRTMRLVDDTNLQVLRLSVLNRSQRLECEFDLRTLLLANPSQALTLQSSSYRLNDNEVNKPCHLTVQQVGVPLPAVAKAPSTTPSSGCRGVQAAREFTATATIHGVKRSYRVQVPSSQTPPALTFIFHGRTNPDVSFIRFGDETIHVYPLGQAQPDQRWWDAKDRSGGLRDYAFFDAMLEGLKKSVCFDQKRIFAVGYSLGASFVNSLGCVRPVIRAFATLGGGILEQQCTKPVAAMVLHSPRDELVPLKEGIRARDVLIKSNKLQQKTIAYPTALLPYENFAVFQCRRYLGSSSYPVVWCPHQEAQAVWGQVGYFHAWMVNQNELVWKFFSSLTQNGAL
jgi:polyhydroxybutyrate depolymerase